MPNKLTIAFQKISPGLHKILGNISWLLFERVLRMGVGFFVAVWIARYLGPEQFGLFSYAIAFVTLFSSIAMLGLDQIVVRDIVREKPNSDEILGTAFAMRLTAGVVVLLLTVGIVSLLRPGDELVHWLVAIIAAGMVFQPFDTIDVWFQSQVKSKYTVCAKSIAFLIASFIKIILVVVGAPLIAFAWVYLAEIFLGASGLVIAYQLYGHHLKKWRVHLARVWGLLSQGWPLIISGLAVIVYMRIDVVMLGELADSDAVGIYSVAVRLSEVWYFIPIAIVSSVLPSLIQAKQVD